jgi:hypothetical protein
MILSGFLAAVPILTVAGLALILPARAAHRAQREAAERREYDEMVAFLMALRPEQPRAREHDELRRTRRALQLGRTDARLAHQHAPRAA